MIVWEAGLIVVIPMAMIAEDADHDAALALIPLTMLEGDIHGFLALVGAPEEAVFFIRGGIGDGCPYAAFIRRRSRRLLCREEIGRPRMSGGDKKHAHRGNRGFQSHF